MITAGRKRVMFSPPLFTPILYCWKKKERNYSNSKERTNKKREETTTTSQLFSVSHYPLSLFLSLRGVGLSDPVPLYILELWGEGEREGERGIWRHCGCMPHWALFWWTGFMGWGGGMWAMGPWWAIPCLWAWLSFNPPRRRELVFQ